MSGHVLGGSASPFTFFQEPATTREQGTGASPAGGLVTPRGSAPRDADRQLFEQRVREQQQRERGVTAHPGTGPAEPNGGPGSAAPAPPSRDTGPPAATRASGTGVRLMFRNEGIDAVINVVMQELGYSYVIDPQVQGTVNIFSMREIPRERLFGVLEQLLKMNGLGIVKQEDYYVILPISQSPTVPHGVMMNVPATPQEEASPTQPSPGEGEGETEETATPEEEPEPRAAVREGPEVLRVGTSTRIEEEGVVTYIIPLHYILSDEMLTMAQVFLSPGSTVIDFAPANLLIITDYPANIEQVLTLVELLDTRYFDLNTVDLIPIRFNQADDVAEDLAKIFSPRDSAAGVRIVAIRRLNSILVVTRSQDVFKEVMRWIDKLDAPSTTSNLKTFVYQVENNTAVQIAQILGELYQDGLGLPSVASGEVVRELESRRDRELGAEAAAQRQAYRDPSFVQTGSRFDRYDQQMGTRGIGGGLGMRELGPALGSASQSQIRAIFAGNVKIVVNEFNNSLIIQGTEGDIQFILETVRQLDTLPRQVVIEAKIYSVELRDDLNYGVAAFLQARGEGLGSDGGSTPATTGSISDGAFSAASRAIIGAERELQAIVNALKEKTNVEILEAPRVLALDGTPASINIGAEVPVTSASFGNPLQTGTTNFINSIQFRPTGTTLLIVPRISASGVVTMELVLEVSSATGPALTPTINRNYIQSTFIVRDGQTIGIAGLISDSHSIERKRVPLVGEVPILGSLFGTTAKSDRRFEMIIFITPRVIRNLPTSAELTLEFKRALRNAYDFIQQMDERQEELIEQRRQRELREGTQRERRMN
jgi:general secretion pathway protein D